MERVNPERPHSDEYEGKGDGGRQHLRTQEHRGVQLQVNLKLSSGKRQRMNESEACSRSKPVQFPEREDDQTKQMSKREPPPLRARCTLITKAHVNNMRGSWDWMCSCGKNCGCGSNIHPSILYCFPLNCIKLNNWNKSNKLIRHLYTLHLNSFGLESDNIAQFFPSILSYSRNKRRLNSTFDLCGGCRCGC